MTTSGAPRLLVLTTEELAPGYRLAGAATVACADATEAAEQIEAALGGGAERGVIAVHEPFYADFDLAFRRRLEQTLPPLVVALPSGADAEGERRERLLQVLWQAVGYGITFDAEGRA
jgi:vacuolar-type H+-ATPase subunit F/Vma7